MSVCVLIWNNRLFLFRIANNQKHGGGGSEDSGQEDENDNDWNYAPDTKRCKCLTLQS